MPARSPAEHQDADVALFAAHLPELFRRLQRPPGNFRVEEIDGRKRVYLAPGSLSNVDKLTIALTRSFHRAKVAALRGDKA